MRSFDRQDLVGEVSVDGGGVCAAVGGDGQLVHLGPLDRQGRLATFARYENFSDYSGISFPGIVSIQRPVEGYGITLSMVKLDVNVSLTDEQFALTQPAGSQLINLDTKSSAAAIREEENKKPRQ